MVVFSTALFSCKCSSKMNTKNFSVESATKQGFVKGIQQPDGKHAGTTYSVTYSANPNVEITNFYLGTKELEFESFMHEGKNYITATLYTNDSKNIEKSASLPLAYQGEALILYKMNEKKYQYIIEKFESVAKVEGK